MEIQEILEAQDAQEKTTVGPTQVGRSSLLARAPGCKHVSCRQLARTASSHAHHWIPWALRLHQGLPIGLNLPPPVKT
jgi:hypothetical protein